MKVLQLADVKEQMFALGAELGGDSPRDFNAFVNASVHTLGAIIRERGIRPE
jgi:tripartite-type tricarboxylate transporter receptor subunit TctC